MFYEISAEKFKRVLKDENGEWIISYDNPNSPIYVSSDIIYSYKKIESPLEYLNAVNKKEKSAAELKRLEMIQKLIDNPEFISNKKERQNAIKEIAQKYKTTERRIQRMYYRYLAKGMILEEKTTKIISDKKIEEHKNFDWAIKNYYYSAKKLSLQSTYDMLLLSKYMDKNGKLLKDIPSFHSFHHFFYDNGYHKKSKKLITRDGLSEYQRNHRPLLGSAMGWKKNIGHFQMDATIADVYLVSRFNRKVIIGRPNIYMAVDTATQLIAGIYIGLEANERAVLLCLANAAKDKVEYCKQYDIDIKKEDWPSEGLPGSIITDQGKEFICNAADELCRIYGMEAEALPPFRPDEKSLVEKTFDILQSKYKPFLRGKGTVEKDAGERWATDYKSQAILNLDEFTKIVLLIVIYLNSGRILNSYITNKEMIEKEVEEIPSKLWKWKLESGKTDIIPVNNVDIYRMSLNRKKGKLDRKGILHNGIYYKNNDLINILEKVKNKNHITIAYDPDYIKYIYLVEKGEYFEFALPNEYVEYFNLNETELEILNKEDNQRKKILEKRETQVRVSTLQKIKEVISKAEFEEKEKQNSDDIKKNREDERSKLS